MSKDPDEVDDCVCVGPVPIQVHVVGHDIEAGTTAVQVEFLPRPLASWRTDDVAAALEAPLLPWQREVMDRLATDRPALKVGPIGLKEANAFVIDHHRHHKASRGHKFSVSVVDEAQRIRGVGIAGRPVSRVLDREGYLEVVRVCTDGTRNACSMIYGALRRAGIALGYEPHKIITYTLATESGASLRAAGWHEDGLAGGGSWDTPSRRREDQAPTEQKRRWRAGVCDV
ncbi:XF1762 family protein [Microbacterium sp. MYb72]|uniref:XF1762 family protein n=1 Tax=Microbacterium sp. MYb72 TaxID=1848693 RepID=UPI001C613C30|nr:XF1762 family protein [Microbacterium sp. MYb72]